MYDYINLIGTQTLEVSWTWQSIIGFISIVGAIATIVKVWDNKVGTKEYSSNESKRDKQMETLRVDICKLLSDHEEQNKGSHARIEDISHQYFDILREQMREERENTDRKLDMIMELIRNSKKTG